MLLFQTYNASQLPLVYIYLKQFQIIQIHGGQVFKTLLSWIYFSGHLQAEVMRVQRDDQRHQHLKQQISTSVRLLGMTVIYTAVFKENRMPPELQMQCMEYIL